MPPWEAALTRRVRNLSIPGAERDQKNPVPVTSEYLEEGRDSFLTHCATCHGVDGSGKTPVGSNLYPSVPDLRSAATQRLSDGEIRCIIENGVQLTGMPDWKLSGAEDDVWKLALFVRSLGPLSPSERARQSAFLASAHYTGSEACEKCHREIYLGA